MHAKYQVSMLEQSRSAGAGAHQGVGERVGAHAEAVHQQRAQRGRGRKRAHVGDYHVDLRCAQALPQDTHTRVCRAMQSKALIKAFLKGGLFKPMVYKGRSRIRMTAYCSNV